MAKVSIVKCEDYNEQRLEEAILRSVENLGGLNCFIKPGDRVLLKPNMLSPKPADTCVTTNPQFVKICAKIVMDFGAKPIVGDSPPLQSCHKVANKTGILDELKKIGVDIIEFKTPVKLKAKDDAVFKDIYVAKEVMDADCIINLPKIKTHTMMTLTGCVKNMFGAVIGKEKSMWHLKAGVNKDHFSRILLDICYGISPALTITDMITVMEGNGPSSGTLKDVGIVVSGSDCVAMDAVICKMLNVPQELVYTQKSAMRSNDPSTNIKNIDIIGEDPNDIAAAVKDFKLPKRTEVDFGIPSPIKKLLRDMLTSKPVIDKKICEYCKECENICPVGGINVSEEKISFDYEKCIRCFCCHEICSYGALKIKQGALLKILSIFG